MKGEGGRGKFLIYQPTALLQLFCHFVIFKIIMLSRRHLEGEFFSMNVLSDTASL